MKLQDIKDGKITVGDRTKITYNGQIYRGKKQIKELIEQALPIVDTKEAANDQATDSAPAAGTKTAAKKPATSSQ